MKNIHTQNLQNSAEAMGYIINLFENGDKQINADCDPDLRLHCVHAGTVESLDAEVLFDPFKEQLNVPSAFINVCDHQSRQGK